MKDERVDENTFDSFLYQMFISNLIQKSDFKGQLIWEPTVSLICRGLDGFQLESSIDLTLYIGDRL